MAAAITEDCINCGACEPECPSEAISFTDGDEFYVIKSDACFECVGYYDAYACQAVCPVECCVPNENKRETEKQLIDKALKLFPDDEDLGQKAAANDYPSRFRT
ncbi:YfhL family 4Fe-4S dicluster ferredoxin [Streptomyces sp. ISL-98]|nr:YfhL family 4Fe-4S dicluster ferredoxin [Streptomyces sp. ISL-98]